MVEQSTTKPSNTYNSRNRAKLEIDMIDFMFIYGFLRGAREDVKKINMQAYYRIEIILKQMQPLYDKHKDDPLT